MMEVPPCEIERSALLLIGLDPLKLTLLRSEANAELKNDIMMLVLRSSKWYVEYADRLDAYRTAGEPMPPYPTERVERVETLVDELIRESVDPSHVR